MIRQINDDATDDLDTLEEGDGGDEQQEEEPQQTDDVADVQRTHRNNFDEQHELTSSFLKGHEASAGVRGFGRGRGAGRAGADRADHPARHHAAGDRVAEGAGAHAVGGPHHEAV